MEIYKDIDNDSSISGYDIGHDFIVVYFNDGSAYLYNNQVTGANNVERMKILARNGEGLNSYINRYVKKIYAQKIR